MNAIRAKAELQSSIGNFLTKVENVNLKKQFDFGQFNFSSEVYNGFAIVRRDFETSGQSINIPFSSEEPCVQLIFSLDGHSFFNNRYEPFMIGRSAHCINFFKRFNCTNLLAERSRQHDYTIRLSKSFYADLVSQHLAFSEDRLVELIATGNEFNTINKHLPMDYAIEGILRNIMTCPFEGQMKEMFLREHIRALFNLQLFHFSSIVTGTALHVDNKLNQSDHDKLHSVKDYIDQNFLDPASLESLSQMFGLNEFKLKHGFKVLFDTSPIRYLQQRRLNFALRLIQETDRPVKEIARELNYSHTANFITAFVRAFGKSPQYFRKKLKLV